MISITENNEPKGISIYMEIENKNLNMNLKLEFKMEKISNIF